MGKKGVQNLARIPWPRVVVRPRIVQAHRQLVPLEITPCAQRKGVRDRYKKIKHAGRITNSVSAWRVTNGRKQRRTRPVKNTKLTSNGGTKACGQTRSRGEAMRDKKRGKRKSWHRKRPQNKRTAFEASIRLLIWQQAKQREGRAGVNKLRGRRVNPEDNQSGPG